MLQNKLSLLNSEELFFFITSISEKELTEIQILSPRQFENQTEMY